MYPTYLSPLPQPHVKAISFQRCFIKQSNFQIFKNSNKITWLNRRYVETGKKIHKLGVSLFSIAMVHHGLNWQRVPMLTKSLLSTSTLTSDRSAYIFLYMCMRSRRRRVKNSLCTFLAWRYPCLDENVSCNYQHLKDWKVMLVLDSSNCRN